MKFRVGDRVEVNCYPGKHVEGTITRIAKERTYTWDYFMAYYVDYDLPVAREGHIGPAFITGGQHQSKDLSRCRA